MHKTVLGKQIKDFMDRFDEEELASMCANINHVMGEAAQTYYDTVNKLAETYPELWIFCEFDTALISSDSVHGEFVHIHIGPGAEKTNG